MDGRTVVEFVVLLLPVTGSITPTGVVTVAVLLKFAPAAADTFPVSVKDTLPVPAGRLAKPPMFPAPLAAGQAAPPDATHVQVAPVMPEGMVSLTPAPLTASGPRLATVMLYVTVPPEETSSGVRLIEMERSAVGIVSVSVALLLAGFDSVIPAGAVTVAVLEKEPDALFETLPLVVAKVIVPPIGILTVRLILPLPEAEPPQVAPPVVEQVQAIVPLRTDGKLSATVAPVTFSGPALLTTIV